MTAERPREPPASTAGFCAPGFESVRDAFAANFLQQADVGASTAVSIDGALVVDLWGGFRDAARTRPWSRDTVVNVYSTTKTITALCALLLAENGALDLFAPVARVWPEFAAEGKRDVTVAQVLGHTAGLPGWSDPVTVSDLYDWDKAVTLLARQAPWWKPGTASGYHAVTQGFLIGEIVRRATGRNINTLLQEELTRPLGVDFLMGPVLESARLAEIVPAPGPAPALEPGSIPDRVANNPRPGVDPVREFAKVPMNGVGNARAVARLNAILACGGTVGGKRFLSPETCTRVLLAQSDGVDRVFLSPVSFGLGWALSLGPLRFGPGRSCFWGGSGGSLIVVDFEHRMTIAYTMNRTVGAPFGDPRNTSIVRAVYESIAGMAGA